MKIVIVEFPVGTVLLPSIWQRCMGG